MDAQPERSVLSRTESAASHLRHLTVAISGHERKGNHCQPRFRVPRCSTPNMGVILWGASPLYLVPVTYRESVYQLHFHRTLVRGEGNWGAATDRGEEA